VRLVVHNGDYKNLGPRTRSPPGRLASKAVDGLSRRSGWLLYRQSASCSRARATSISKFGLSAFHPDPVGRLQSKRRARTTAVAVMAAEQTGTSGALGGPSLRRFAAVWSSVRGAVAEHSGGPFGARRLELRHPTPPASRQAD
jgi:hypothetical protein